MGHQPWTSGKEIRTKRQESLPERCKRRKNKKNVLCPSKEEGIGHEGLDLVQWQASVNNRSLFFIWYALVLSYHPIFRLPWIPMRLPSFSGNGPKREKSLEKQENASQVKKRLPSLSSAVTLPPLSYLRQSINGQVSEWSNEHAWKVCVLATVPRVRIPPCPPFYSFHNLAKSLILQGFFISWLYRIRPDCMKKGYILGYTFTICTLMYPIANSNWFLRLWLDWKNGTIHGLPPITSMAKE